MPTNHEAAIAHVNKQLGEYGVVAFPEVAKAGCRIHRDGITTRTGKTAGYVADLLEDGDHVLTSVPRGSKSHQRSGNTTTSSVYHIVEKELEPFVSLVSTGSGSKQGFGVLRSFLELETKVTDNRVVFDCSRKGPRKLVKMGILKKLKFGYGEKPKLARSSYEIFEVTNPELLNRAIKAVKRVIELREEGYK